METSIMAYTVEGIIPLEEDKLSKGTFLCLFGVDKIPPHLGVLKDGKYYSSSAKGNRVGEQKELILRRVKQSTIPSLFIELDLEGDNEKLQFAFEKYPKLTKGQTCLMPIKEWLFSQGVNCLEAAFVFELIPVLKQEGMIKGGNALYMDDLLQDGTFELKQYTKEDITNRIVKLQETC